jgi:hypothetical protein
VDEDGAAGLAGEDVTLARGPGFLATVVRLVVVIAVVAVGVGVAAWVVLGLTVLPTMNVGGEIWAAKWAAYPTGAVPAGAVIAVSDRPVQRGLGDRFASLVGMGGDTRTVHLVVAGPGYEVHSEPGGPVLWNGQDTGYVTDVPIVSHLLGEKYLTVCVAGDCGGPGTVTEVPAANVVGQAMGTYSPPFSFASPTLPSKNGG